MNQTDEFRKILFQTHFTVLSNVGDIFDPRQVRPGLGVSRRISRFASVSTQKGRDADVFHVTLVQNGSYQWSTEITLQNNQC
jgi:hypothetical protein